MLLLSQIHTIGSRTRKDLNSHTAKKMIQQPHIMIDEAPDSPRCAAIYYWGGGEEESKENYSNLSNLYESTFHKRTSHQRRRPAAGKI